MTWLSMYYSPKKYKKIRLEPISELSKFTSYKTNKQKSINLGKLTFKIQYHRQRFKKKREIIVNLTTHVQDFYTETTKCWWKNKRASK